MYPTLSETRRCLIINQTINVFRLKETYGKNCRPMSVHFYKFLLTTSVTYSFISLIAFFLSSRLYEAMISRVNKFPHITVIHLLG